jgi:hypothetical protein
MHYLCLEGEQVPIKINTLNKNIAYGKTLSGIIIFIFLLLFILINNEFPFKYQIINVKNHAAHCYHIDNSLLFYCFSVVISLLFCCYFHCYYMVFDVSKIAYVSYLS